jgi:hypothetical protein
MNALTRPDLPARYAFAQARKRVVTETFKVVPQPAAGCAFSCCPGGDRPDLCRSFRGPLSRAIPRQPNTQTYCPRNCGDNAGVAAVGIIRITNRTMTPLASAFLDLTRQAMGEFRAASFNFRLSLSTRGTSPILSDPDARGTRSASAQARLGAKILDLLNRDKPLGEIVCRPRIEGLASRLCAIAQ